MKNNTLLSSFKKNVSDQMKTKNSFVGETDIIVHGYKVTVQNGIPCSCEIPSCWPHYVALRDVLTLMGADKGLLESLLTGYVLSHRKSVRLVDIQ